MKLFSLAPQEQTAVLGFGSIIAVRATGKALGWSAVQAILLKRWGVERLADSFIWFAIFGMLGSLIYIIIADAWHRSSILKNYAVITGSIMILAVFFAPNNDSMTQKISLDLIIFSILIMVASTFGDGTLGIQTWTLIGDAFHHQQGVRVYPILASFHLIGGICGGLLLQVLSKYFPSEYFILLWGLSILAVYPLVQILETLSPQSFADYKSSTTYASQSRRLGRQFQQGFKFAFNSPLIYALSGICVLFWTVASLKEFQYCQILNQEFVTEETINTYYGLYTIALNSTVLLFQLKTTSQVIKKLGVAHCFILLPATILVGIITVAILPTLFIAIAMRYTWDIVAMTVQGSSFQLSFNAVPTIYRGRIRGLLEGIINPVGGILGGLLFKFLDTAKNNIESVSLGVAVLGIIFSLIWLLIALLIPQQYREQIIANLHSSDIRTKQDAQEMLKEFQERPTMKPPLHKQKPEKILSKDNIFSPEQNLFLSPTIQRETPIQEESPMQWAYSQLSDSTRIHRSIPTDSTKVHRSIPPDSTKVHRSIPPDSTKVHKSIPPNFSVTPQTAMIHTTPQACTFSKRFLSNLADLKLIIRYGAGCQQIILKIDDVSWYSKPRGEQIIIKRQCQEDTKYIIHSPGLLYWQHTLGYIAVVWEKQQVVVLEVGDYDLGYVEVILIKNDQFKGPYRLKSKERYIQPIPRFDSDILHKGLAIE